MSGKTRRVSDRIGEYRVVRDFLPSPDQLAFREEGVKITLALSRRSVQFFKTHAARNGTQYQRMIRDLLDAYVDAHESRSASEGPKTRRK